jgi:centromere protein C
MARFRATTNNQGRRVEATGKRTGVNILSQDIVVQDDGFENPDAFFTQEPEPVQEKENPVEHRAKFTRFSLGSLHQDDAASTSAASTKRMLGRVKGLGSPSELSRVSTASSSTASQREESQDPVMNDDNDVEEEEVVRQATIQEEGEEDNDEGEQLDEEKAAGRENDQLNDAGSVVEEDDFMPPGPPDSPERDDEIEVPTQAADHSIDFPTQTSADEESEDEMAESRPPEYSMPTTETPQSAKVLRKEQVKSSKDDKKRKKVQLVETSEDESEEVKPKKKGKASKKSKYATIFSPKGIPLPREYEALPVDNFRNTQEEENDGKPCRRSKRARCKPLQFWKNEKFTYGPNEDMDVTSDIAKMPIPKAVIKAKETPYKPRPTRPRVVSGGKSKNKATASQEDVPAPPVEYDSRRLRKKYNYLDDEEVAMWDDATEEAQEMSKYIFWKGKS